MRAYIEEGQLHLVTREYLRLTDGTEYPEEEMVFDVVHTIAMREAFRKELVKELNESTIRTM